MPPSGQTGHILDVNLIQHCCIVGSNTHCDLCGHLVFQKGLCRQWQVEERKREEKEQAVVI